MRSVNEIEEAILELPPEDKSRILEWFDDHREDLVPLGEAQATELRTRREELRANPDLATPIDDAFFGQLRRKVADVRSGQTSTR